MYFFKAFSITNTSLIILGYETRTRFCIYPAQAPAGSGCHGPAYQVRTCIKPAPCDSYPSSSKFATGACKTYMKKNTRLSLALTGVGKQMPYTNKRPEQACTIYCEQVSYAIIKVCII